MEARRTTDTKKRILEMITNRITEAEKLQEELRAATTAAERKDIYSREKFNSYLLGALLRLFTGQMPTVPETI